MSRFMTIKAEEKAEAPADAFAKPYQILAVTACPTGIAHTYMAAEGLEKKAKEKLEKDSDSQYSVPFYRPVCDEARTGCSDGPRNRFQWESIAHDGGCPGCVCLSNAQLPSG